MDIDNLVHMANRIGEFFAAMPDREEAKDGIADHLRKFWDPRMRRALLAHAARNDAPRLADLVHEAVRDREASLRPKEAAAS